MVCFENLFRLSLLYRNNLFLLFRFYTETESFDVSIELKQTEDQPKQFDREHIWVLFRKFRVRFVSKQFCLFWLFPYRFETPKQTEFFCFCFHETNRNTTETDPVFVCFGSNRIFFFCFVDTLVRGFLLVGTERYLPVFFGRNSDLTMNFTYFISFAVKRPTEAIPMLTGVWSQAATRN